jgi:hypothetical protein
VYACSRSIHSISGEIEKNLYKDFSLFRQIKRQDTVINQGIITIETIYFCALSVADFKFMPVLNQPRHYHN